MSTFLSGKSEKNAKSDAKLIKKFQRKSCSTTHLHFVLSNPTILKAFPETFPTEIKPSKCLPKKLGKKSEKRGEERKQKVNVETLNFNFYARLNFSIWNETLRTDLLENGVFGSFDSL